MKQFMKILRYILKGVAALIILLLLIELVIYSLAPVYRFEEPRPFSGNRWYNPYHEIDTAHWRRANFHFHTLRWGGITSGKGTEQDCYDRYKKLGYTVSAISHYQYITEFQKDSPYYIPVYEHGIGLWKKHQMLVGAKEVLWFDYPFFQNLHHKQHILNLLRNESEIVTIAHPDWEDGYTVDDVKYLSNYDLMEIIDINWRSFKQWDAALSAGRPVFIQGSDDGHNIFDPYVVGRRCTYINSPTRNAADLMHNLKTGNAFGADVYMSDGESFEEKERLARLIPKITGISIPGDTLRITLTAWARKVTFIGQNGSIRKIQYLTNAPWYALQPEDTYIRTEIQFFNKYGGPGTMFYLNPVIRSDGNRPVNRLTATINRERTWIFRIMTLGSLAVIIFLAARYQWRKRIRKAG